MTPKTSPRIWVCGLGGQTAIGRDPASIWAAARAGVARLRESNTLRSGRDGHAFVLALCAYLGSDYDCVSRMLRLARVAVRQAWAPLAAAPLPGDIPLLLSVPPKRPGFELEQRDRLLEGLFADLPFAAHEELSGLYDTGHEGGISTLARARVLLQEGQVSACIVGGCDSHVDIELLHWLEHERRLKSADAPSGIIPGEGAGFLLLLTEERARELSLPSFGVLRAACSDVEPNPWYTKQACQAQGLTRAMAAAFEETGDPSFCADFTYSDATGEPWRTDEWSYAYLRTGPHHGDPIDHRHPADCWGDLGAAAVPLLAQVALLELSDPRNAARAALIYAASDLGPERGAALFQRLAAGEKSAWPLPLS